MFQKGTLDNLRLATIDSCSAVSSLIRLLLGWGVGRGRRGRVDHVDGRLVDRLVDEHGQIVVR